MHRSTAIVLGILTTLALFGGTGCQSSGGAAGWVDLFNGKDTCGWVNASPEQPMSWTVTDGLLTNAPQAGKRGVDIHSEQMFDDFELHTEFKLPENSNSGIYLRGRYEVQINSHAGPLSQESMGGVYSLHTPTELASHPWDQWQIFDIRLVGTTLTVVLNGKTILDQMDLPNATPGGTDRFKDTSKPGPIYIQGDHGPIAFRAIRIRPIAAAAK